MIHPHYFYLTLQQAVPVQGTSGWILHTLRHIDVGEELTIEHASDYWAEPKMCLCEDCSPGSSIVKALVLAGTSRTSETLGDRPVPRKRNKPNNKKRKRLLEIARLERERQQANGPEEEGLTSI